MKKYLFVIIISFSLLSSAQNNRQNIRGVVSDKLTKTHLGGATLLVIVNGQKRGTISDGDGSYILSNIPPDRYEIVVSYTGYKSVVIPNVIVTSGKESILDIYMEEELLNYKEVVITINDKDKTINDLATNSARTFSMEEVNRYAGGRGDPARLAANFAGVSAPDDSRNDIVIRGNSPVGVLWKIDGMNVTNPNHFATVGTTGGAVSALNTNLLKSSDFFTSAFPAEYGNALSGVFDLGLRNGNSQKRESTLQFGLITGIEAMTEGPLLANNGSSYLVAYRYSLAGIAQAIGIDIGTTSTPIYQDLSFKLNSGNSSIGTFSLFGILARSNISITVDKNKSSSLYAPGDNTELSSDIGIIGLQHFLQLNNYSYLSSSVGINYSKTFNQQDSSDFEGNSVKSREEEKVTKLVYEFSSNYNTKLGSNLFLKLGFQYELMNLNLYYRTRRDFPDWKQIWDYDSYASFLQIYGHLKYSISDVLTLNAGVHAQEFFLNNSTSVEPRFGLKYDLNSISSVTLGYGLHSQMQPLNIYFLQTQNRDGSVSYNNLNLNFTKSHHFVVGYDLQPFENWRVKAEIYYQSLYDVPVNIFSSSYSMLNTGATFKTDLEDSLTNSGTGRNYGIELTIEKFFSDGYYGLFTCSIYDSKYTSSDGVERNTAFNGNYVYNILFGKEWKVGSEEINRLSVDFKLTNAGGRYYTPVDLQTSRMRGREVLQGNDYVYSSRYSSYFRMDLKIGFTLNSSSSQISHSFSLDLQNVTNNKNVFSESYDRGEIKTNYQLGLFPNFTYKLQF